MPLVSILPESISVLHFLFSTFFFIYLPSLHLTLRSLKIGTDGILCHLSISIHNKWSLPIFILLHLMRNWKIPHFIKNCAFVLRCLNFSRLQSTLHLMQYTYQDFLPLLKTVFELISFDEFLLLVLLLFFASPLPHQQNVSLCDFFHPGKQQKLSHWSEIGGIGRVGHRAHAVSGQKLLNTQWRVCRCAHKSPTVNIQEKILDTVTW